MSKISPVSEKIFRQYEHLAIKYASKVYNYEKLAVEREDIDQEFRIKLYQSILTYGRSLSKYQETGLKKPMPINYYLKTVMSNHVTDLIKEISHKKVQIFESSDLIESHDYSEHNNNSSTINLEDQIIVINGVDLLTGLTSIERLVFIWYIKGIEQEKIIKVFSKRVDVVRVINKRKNLLKQNFRLFSPEPSQEFYVKNYVEEY